MMFVHIMEAMSLCVVLSKQLVDLPCVVESLKSTDRKNFFKTANVCQVIDAVH